MEILPISAQLNIESLIDQHDCIRNFNHLLCKFINKKTVLPISTKNTFLLPICVPAIVKPSVYLLFCSHHRCYCIKAA